jgi:hypothetical protein
MADTNKIAIEVLQRRASELVAQRTTIRRRLLEDAALDIQIERAIAGCIAGAAALGTDIEVPPATPKFTNPNGPAAYNNFISSRTAIAGTAQHLGPVYGVGDNEVAEEEDGEPGARPEMPRIADIVLERLKEAGEDGEKAAAIRRYILATYNADIHEKTVCMTLYRLQKDGEVRRDGHTWFLASIPEAKDPGAEDAGAN